jgi:hypothetical protein
VVGLKAALFLYYTEAIINLSQYFKLTYSSEIYYDTVSNSRPDDDDDDDDEYIGMDTVGNGCGTLQAGTKYMEMSFAVPATQQCYCISSCNCQYLLIISQHLGVML